MLGGVALAAPVLAGVLLFSGWLTSEEEDVPESNAQAPVQAPRLAIDMVPSSNSYDSGTHSMTVGQIDYCLENPPPGNNAAHNHLAQIVISGVEDLVGWQARLNYEGAFMRPQSVTFGVFQDDARAQNVSFPNLPIDGAGGVHRSITEVANIPPAAVGPQTALIGSAYMGDQNFAVSPDTPPKLLPDDSSYSAPGGGVLAQILLEVHANRAGDVLYLDLDDSSPNAPGSKATVFTGSGTSDIDLLAATMADGFHAEGTSCPVLGGVPTVNPGLIPPPPEADGGTSVVPPGVTIPPEITPPPPTSITIRGQQVPLAPGMRYWLSNPSIDPAPSSPIQDRWMVTYDSDPNTPGDSWITFDLDYNLLGSHIRPEDEEEFQPLLDALASP